MQPLVACKSSGTKNFVPYRQSTFSDVFLEISTQSADYGVVPIENTVAGSIYENYDLLDRHRSSIVGEHCLSIHHSLLVSPRLGSLALSEAIAGLKAAYSHPKALEQCKSFFEQNPHIVPMPATATANAARQVAERDDPSVAAIASENAGKAYDLFSLAKNIEDNQQNFTRFIVIAKDGEVVPDADKCSVMLYLPHTRGSLQNALQVIADTGCNLTKIESRPLIGKPFEYLFYLDFGFANSDTPISEVISKLSQASGICTPLGIYKAKDWQ